MSQRDDEQREVGQDADPQNPQLDSAQVPNPPRSEAAPDATTVTAHIEAQVTATAELVFEVAVARTEQGPDVLEEELSATLDGAPLELVEIVGPVGTRFHVARGVQPGHLVLDYSAATTGAAPSGEVTDYDAMVMRRPSRYAESDKLANMAVKLFGSHLDGGDPGQELVDAVVEWVYQNTFYVEGSSGPTDGAVDTFLQQQGVCRDFAHLVIALLRACGLPARLVSVYAPGLSPMDFHAVAEVAVGGRWQVVDATRLAPRASLVRIATGHDAADTAFLTVQSGEVTFGSVAVTAVSGGGLPTEDPAAVVELGSRQHGAADGR